MKSRRLAAVGRLAAVTPLYAFLLASPAIVAYTSFQTSVALDWPPAWTVRWYARAAAEGRFAAGLEISLLVATIATMAALLIGVPAAYAIVRRDVPGRRWIEAIVLAPLTLPALVLAIGLLMFLVSIVQPLTGVTLVGTPIPLLLAHVVIAVPWVIRTVAASLASTDPSLEDAARGLGASPMAAFWLVTLPTIRSGVMAAAVFAFIVSFGNFALSLFFTGGRVVTLPVAIFEYVDQFQDPTVAAISTLVIVFTSILVAVAAHLAGGDTRKAVS